MAGNMLLRKIGPLIVARETKQSPTDYEWNDFLALLAKHRKELSSSIKILVRTDGGVATAAQRARLAETLGDAEALVAVVSDAMMVRFAGATIALFQPRYRQYTTKEIGEAYQHLGLTPSEQRLAETAMKELEAILYPKTEPRARGEEEGRFR